MLKKRSYSVLRRTFIKLKYLHGVLEILDKRYQDLTLLNSIIYEALLKEELIDEELSKADECSFQYLKLKSEAKEIISKYGTSNTPPENVIKISNDGTNFNLQKIKLKQFEGEIEQLLPFWDRFKKNHLDDRIDGCDK
ncbi:hypothetical protein FQR65_LT11743 [Abscondita terminalis]|nr:hypothetical protein FQR65_LT11743 [Abscondita terminalis]